MPHAIIWFKTMFAVTAASVRAKTMQLPTGCVLKWDALQESRMFCNLSEIDCLDRSRFFPAALWRVQAYAYMTWALFQHGRPYSEHGGPFKRKSSQDLIFRCLTACNSSSMGKRTGILDCQCGPPYRSCSHFVVQMVPFEKKNKNFSAEFWCKCVASWLNIQCCGSSISNFQAQWFPQIWDPCGNEAHMADLRKLDAFQARNCLRSVLEFRTMTSAQKSYVKSYFIHYIC